jgi:hypothetical protein
MIVLILFSIYFIIVIVYALVSNNQITSHFFIAWPAAVPNVLLYALELILVQQLLLYSKLVSGLALKN